MRAKAITSYPTKMGKAQLPPYTNAKGQNGMTRTLNKGRDGQRDQRRHAQTTTKNNIVQEEFWFRVTENKANARAH